MLSRTLPASSFPKRRKPVRSGIERAPQREFPRHRKFVRSHHCIVPGCERLDIECCHIRSAFDAGTGLKSPDWRTFPACRFHHAEQHMIGQGSFEDRHSIDLDQIAAQLARQTPDHKMRLALLEQTLDTPANPLGLIPIINNPQPQDTPHVPTRRKPPDLSVADPRHEHAERPALPHSRSGTALVRDEERESLRRDAQDGRKGVPAEVSGGPGRNSPAHLQRAELAYLERGHCAQPAPVDPADISTLEAEIIRELRAMAERPIARVYRGSVGRAQALAMWRGLMKPAEAMAFARITRLGRKVLALAGSPPPIPRKTVEVYAPVATVMARVA